MAMINNANDVLFDLCTRLKDNGVVANVNGSYEFSKYNTPIDFVERISELDFSEHDKVFEDKIDKLEKRVKELDRIGAIRIDEKRELKRRIAELENKETVELPFDALETANMLINATYSRKTSSVEKVFTGCNVVKGDIYSVDDLEQIAEHLLVYCKHNREDEE